LSPNDSTVYALLRESAEGKDKALVLVNTGLEAGNWVEVDGRRLRIAATQNASGTGEIAPPNELAAWVDLLGQPLPKIKQGPNETWLCQLPPGAAYCLAPTLVPQGLHGTDYRRCRAQAAWGFEALNRTLPLEEIGELDWRQLAAEVDRSPAQFLSAISHLKS